MTPQPQQPPVAPQPKAEQAPPLNPALAGVLNEPADPDTFTWFKG